MRLLIAAPPNLLNPSHVRTAIEQSGLEPSELLLNGKSRGSTRTWVREWAKDNEISVREFDDTSEAFALLEQEEEGAVVAVVSPDHPETLNLVSKAEGKGLPVYIFRELYRQDPRVNCRFSPVERPDVWLKALTTEQRDFFRRLHALCKEYKVELKTAATGDGGSLLHFADGTQFEAVDLDRKRCRVRPRGSFRYRKIPLE